ncbi:MAG TPA: preprotein translocase subunit YajC [Terriglobia bacterium]|nr:preprotein translocase subunit YajC [Terriglobia bacterium]
MPPICLVFAASPSSGQALVQMLPILLIFAVFYFLLIVPQQRQKKKTQEMLSNLKSGDRVITTGGVFGTIIGFREGVVQLQIASQVKIDVSRTAIAGLQPEEGDANGKQGDGGKKK